MDTPVASAAVGVAEEAVAAAVVLEVVEVAGRPVVGEACRDPPVAVDVPAEAQSLDLPVAVGLGRAAAVHPGPTWVAAVRLDPIWVAEALHVPMWVVERINLAELP